MANIEEQRAALDQNFKLALTQWRAFTGNVQTFAADFRNVQEENAAMRQQLRKLESKVGDVERLRRENESLQKQLREALAVKTQDGSDDEHFSVPATQVLVDTPPASEEITIHYSRLLQQSHEQAAMINTLTELLHAEKEKSKKWRLKYNVSSSPAPPPPQQAPVTKKSRPTAPLPSDPPYPSTAFDPRPLDDDCSGVSASPDLHSEETMSLKLEPKFEPSQEDVKPKKVLQESNGNAWKKRKVASSREVEAISSLAEDGEEYHKEFGPTVSTKNSSPALTNAHRRLGQLLSDPNPPRSRISGADAFLPPRRAAVARDSSPRRPRFLRPKPRKSFTDPEDEEPFRARPLQRLSLNHFKINPDTNEGLDFAYQDVVRNHHARKCLSGCTANCCLDKWRALARTLYNTDNRGEETLDQQISNNSLLLDMFGPNSEEKIRTLTPAARANLIEEARVREISARYSKHRAAHQRAASPPGFWDADMPGTQETAENREKADKLEREEVERRYQDAMKGNGRWMFADE